MKKVLYYLIPFLLCAIIVVVFLAAQGSFAKTGKGLIFDLCNAFTVSGAAMTGVGLLVFVTNGGAFDMLAFGFIKLFDLFKKDLTKVKYRTFYDYHKAQGDKKRSFLHLLLIGMGYLIVAVIFLVVYNYK